MNPGEFNKRVRVQKKEVVTNLETGLSAEAWPDLGATPDKPEVYRWAKWEWMHGSEFWKAAAVNSKVVAQVTMRYIKGIQPDMRVMYKDEYYQILPPINNIRERNAYISFKVSTVESG